MNFLSGSFCSRLNLYVGAGIGVGCLAGQSEATTVVTTFGTEVKTHASAPGIEVGRISILTRYLTGVSGGAVFGANGNGVFLTSGSDLVATMITNSMYASITTATNGAVFNSNQNYANVSFNGNDGVYEAVVQFYLTGNGTGYLVAMAKNDDNTALSISAGKAAIDGVPEPSGLALLALGAGGLLARRRRAA